MWRDSTYDYFPVEKECNRKASNYIIVCHYIIHKTRNIRKVRYGMSRGWAF